MKKPKQRKTAGTPSILTNEMIVRETLIMFEHHVVRAIRFPTVFGGKLPYPRRQSFAR